MSSIAIICAPVNNVTGKRPEVYAVLYLYNFLWCGEGKGEK